MTPKKFSGKAVWAVSVAVVLVVFLLILLFVTQAPTQEETIILPSVSDVPKKDDSDITDPEEGLVQNDVFEVSNDNVLMALHSLVRPFSYHQTYTVTVGSDALQSSNVVELWVNGPYVHAEISDSQFTRCLISDGTMVYFWYKNDDAVISVSLEDGMILEDLLGIPNLDAHLALEQSAVIDSDYLVLDDPKVQCIYVSAQGENRVTVRHWVNLENGLLFQSDILEDGNQVYVIRQTSFEILAAEDESFLNCFILPDGSKPFTAASRMLQP